MNTTEFDALMKQLDAPKTKPSWMKKSPARIAYCAHCHTQFGKAELNAEQHCRHCADELGEAHPMNTELAPAIDDEPAYDEFRAWAEYQPEPRLPLATPVRLHRGVLGVVCGHNPNDAQRYLICWFDRHFWRVRYDWTSRRQFEVA